MFKYYVSVVSEGDFHAAVIERKTRIESEEDVFEMVQQLKEMFDAEVLVPISWNYLGVSK